MSQLDLKLLFVQWLDEQFEKLTKKGSKVAYAYSKALEKIRSYLDQVTSPRQLNSIQFVGAKLVKFLCARLKKHCLANSVPMPVEFENYVGTAAGGKRSHELDSQENSRKKIATKWVPKRRGGSWAILVSLYIEDKGRKGLRKEDIVTVAEKYCDRAFTANPAANEYYSAWDGIKTLVKRELVEEFGRPKTYVITEEGVRMASVILNQEGIHSSPAPAADFSFDNGMRVSPETSAANSLAFAGCDLFSSPLKPHKTPIVEVLDGASTGDTFAQDLRENNQAATRMDRAVPQSTLKPSTSVYSHINTFFPLLKGVHDAAGRIYQGTPYDVWLPEDFEVMLLLDNREVRSKSERDYFYKRIDGRGVACDVRPLSVGDVLWVARHRKTGREVVLNYICERKRIDDLAGSIKDGRFAEQKSRLKKSGIKNVHYIVEEGGLGDMSRNLDMKTSIETSISMVITVSNFYLQRFRKIDDTTDWLVAMTQVLKEKYSGVRLLVLKPATVSTQDLYLALLQDFRLKFESRKTQYECVHQYAVFHKLLVKSMMTVKEMFLKMLMLVRGISFEKAIVIQRHFGTPRGLIEFYIENDNLSEQEKGMLIFAKFEVEAGLRRINKAALIAMYEAWGKPVC